MVLLTDQHYQQCNYLNQVPLPFLFLICNIIFSITWLGFFGFVFLWNKFTLLTITTATTFHWWMVTILSRTTHCAKWPACTLSQNLGESRRSHCQGPHSPKLAASVRGRGKPLLWPLPGCPEIPHESIITETEIFSNLDVYVNHMYYMHVSRAAGFQIL